MKGGKEQDKMAYRRWLRVVALFSFLAPSVGAVSFPEDVNLVSAVPLSQIAVQLRFSKALVREPAEDVANYRIEPGVKVESADLNTRTNVVLLFTTPLKVGAVYTLTVQCVRTVVQEAAISLAPTTEITFGVGDAVTFSGGPQDTFLIADAKNKKTRNYNAGGETFLRCTPGGDVFFVAFDLFDAFDALGITRGDQILKASISLYAEPGDIGEPQDIIIRRVLLPWREGRQKSQKAEENDLTYSSALHKNFPWNKPPAQAMLEGINGNEESDYNGSEDVAHRIDGMATIRGTAGRYVWEGALVTAACRFWVENPDYNYGYLFALRDGTAALQFSSKEHPDENRRPLLRIQYRTAVESEN